MSLLVISCSRLFRSGLPENSHSSSSVYLASIRSGSTYEVSKSLFTVRARAKLFLTFLFRLAGGEGFLSFLVWMVSSCLLPLPSNLLPLF
jgi:hypothetical protein